MKDAFIGLGANIGRPADQLIAACRHLASLKSSVLLDLSKVYSSAPMGPQDQPDFLNACAHIKTALEPETLLQRLQDIENTMGRNRVRHWGERCIDLDIIQMGEQLIHDNDLLIPHPGISERLFVVEPMIELLGADHKVPGLDDLGTLRDELKHHSISLCQDIDINDATVAYAGMF